MKREIWKAIGGWEGFYEVSNLGRVRSLDRVKIHAKHGKPVRYRGRILKTDRKLSKSYPICVLVDGDRRKRTATVHRLVAEAFIPNPKGLPVVRHKDDNPMNPAASNLLWGTIKDNSDDRKCPHCGGFLFKRKKAA